MAALDMHAPSALVAVRQQSIVKCTGTTHMKTCAAPGDKPVGKHKILLFRLCDSRSPQGDVPRLITDSPGMDDK